MLTNAYYPKKNISEEEYLNIKNNWLIKNNNLELIEDFLVKNNDRIAQLVFSEVVKVSLNEVDDLDQTLRDQKGFGSTGK